MKGIDKEHLIFYQMASTLHLPRNSTEDIENAHITSLKKNPLLCILIGWLAVNTVCRSERNSWQAIPRQIKYNML